MPTLLMTRQTSGDTARARASDGYLIEDRPTGYVIQSLAPVSILRCALQTATMVAGSLLIAGSIATLMFVSLDDLLLAAPLVLGLFGLGLLVIRLASCALRTQFQVDMVRREVREIATARTGALTVWARYPFERFESVFIDRSEPVPRLCLRLSGTQGRLVLTDGDDRQLGLLRDRLGRDILGGT